MATVSEHYARVLSPVYSWMYGGFDAALERNAQFFATHGVTGPTASGIAVDLGAGCGFQSIPLARLGYKVTAIDLDRGLLDELAGHARGLEVERVQGDLLDFEEHVGCDVELAVCMTDTLLHLESAADAARLYASVLGALAPDGRLILTFRDLARELDGLDRFIPVRSDADRIFTCFLEYESETVKVHDLVHTRSEGGWNLAKSFYRKLRLSAEQVAGDLRRIGYSTVETSSDSGVTTIVACR